jgi:hypothetical protein
VCNLGENEGRQGNVSPGIDDVVEFIEYIGCPFLRIFGLGNMGIAGKEDLSLNSGEGFGDNGDRRRLLVFACDGRK